VYGKGIGVNHVAFEGGSDDFVAVMKTQDLAEGKLTRVDAAGIPAVLLRQGKSIYAIAATCSHLGGPLDEGTVNDGVVQCPWHGSCFRMSDGSIVHGPATYAQPTFAVRLRDGNIELRRLEHA
jgi:nitrite reductase/ring-hydroxylating ferredoxin subunit